MCKAGLQQAGKALKGRGFRRCRSLTPATGSAEIWVCLPLTAAADHDDPTLCHLDRSEAQWRDLRFRGPFLEMFSCALQEKQSQEKAFTQRSLHYASLRSR
jgi:hypothetical protein